MTKRKRSAEEELTSCSVPVIQPIAQAPGGQSTMNAVLSMFISPWKLIMSWVSPPVPTDLTYTDLTYRATEVVAETYVQSSEVRIDETTTLKRQKTRTMQRSRSAGDGPRRSGRGNIDVSGLGTGAEARLAIDEFWRPREHILLRKKSGAFRRRQSPPPPSRSQDDTALDSSPRRHSDSSELSPRLAPQPFSQKRFDLHPSKPQKQPTQQNLRTEGKTKDAGLNEQLDKLLIDDHDQKDSPVLLQSQSKWKQREEIQRRRLKEEAEFRKKIEAEQRELAAKARKAALLFRRLPRKPLIDLLPSKWEWDVNEIFKQPLGKVLTTGVTGTDLAVKDFRTLLNPHSWLNDEIINAYIEWVVDAANKRAAAQAAADGVEMSKVPSFIAHNSFFYNNLLNKGPSSTDRLMKRKGAPGKSLLEVETVFVPICAGHHWTVGAVRPAVKTIEYFDSFGGQSYTFIKHMRAWLQHQLGDAYVAEEWTEPETACARQSNGYDCGVFVCTNAFCVGHGIETSCYLEQDMTQQRRNIAAVLLNRGFNGDFSWENLDL